MDKPRAALRLVFVHAALCGCGATALAQTPPVPPGQSGQPPKRVEPTQATQATRPTQATQATQHPEAGTSKTTRLRTGTPNSWFDRTRLQMGDHLRKEVVKGKFTFRNPHKRVIVWSNLRGSCQCAEVIIRVGKRKFTLSRHPKMNSLHEVVLKSGVEVKKPASMVKIDPEETGEVEVHMDMTHLRGIKDASLQFATTDPKHPSMMLKWEVLGINLFDISPPDFHLNELKWDDRKVFRFTIRSAVKKDFKLLDHEPLPGFVKVKKRQIKLPNGDPAWEVSGTFGPKADKDTGGIAIKFKTDLDDKVVTLNVIARVTAPISVRPGPVILFGMIKRGKGISREVTLVADSGFKLKVEKVEFQDLSISRQYLGVKVVRAGNRVLVTLKVLPEAKVRGVIVRGTMILHLNHPAVKTQKITFSGSLR